MDRKKLERLKAEIESARIKTLSGKDLERLARMAGRNPESGGNHIMWRSAFAGKRAFPLGRHGGNPDISERIKHQILDHLEGDAADWEEVIGIGDEGAE